jgi:hypothetical protein
MTMLVDVLVDDRQGQLTVLTAKPADMSDGVDLLHLNSK